MVKEAKKTVQVALKSEFGFAPALSDIRVIEATEEQNVITKAKVEVNGKRYSFDSYVMYIGEQPTVWCGYGTIKRELVE